MTTDQHDPLQTVHSALQEASLASKHERPMRNFSVRLPDDIRDRASEICQHHGTDLGTFLRECCKSLCKDYGATPEDPSKP